MLQAVAFDDTVPAPDPAAEIARLREALAEAEQRARDFIAVASDWFWETDEQLRFTFFSGRLEEVTGASAQYFLGKTRREIMLDSTDAAMQRHLADLDARRPFRNFVYEVRTPRGQRVFQVSGTPVYDAHGRFRGYRGSGTDLTAEVEAQRAAEGLMRQFTEAIESIPASFLLCDRDDRIVLVNSVTARFFPRVAHLLKPGIAFEDLIRAQALSGYVPEASGREEAWVAERMRHHRDPQGTITRHYQDGRWVQIIERKTSDGGIVGIRVDVTDLKTNEQELANKSRLLQATLDNISQGLSVFDGELKLAAFNNRFLELLAFPPELGQVGRPFADFIRYNAERGDYGPGDPERQVAERVALARDPRPHHLERVRPDGTALEIRGAPMPGGGFVTTYADITEHRRAQEAIASHSRRVSEYARELERSNSELEQFAYVASHDLQEPLRMVGSYCQLLQRRYKGKLDADADEFIAYAVEGATRMQRMINDLLAYSRVGRKGKPFERLGLADIFAGAVANLRVAIEESRAQVTCGALPEVTGDRTQLTQLLQNLIANALKFRRPDAAPVIRVEAVREDAHWHCTVRDNGIGIEPQYAEKIFLIFQRLHEREKYPGTGIGLAVCKKVVERHGGRIWVESALGAGSTFHFTLSAQEDGQTAATSHAQ